MHGSLRLYLRYLAISLRSQMQYRASFIMLSLGILSVSFTEFLAIWALFARFDSIQGWSFAQVALLYGIVHVAFAITEGLLRGFDTFASAVRSGEFDRVLLRPQSTALQIAGRQLQLARVGAFTQGVAVLIWAAFSLELRWTAPRLILVLFSIGGGACLFGGLFILQATMCFWTTESLEIMNTVTYGGVETAQYPLIVYRDWFRKVFTYIVPLAAVTYFPVLAILGREDPLGSSVLFQSLAPGIGVVFLFVSLLVWRIGVRHYCSTGS